MIGRKPRDAVLRQPAKVVRLHMHRKQKRHGNHHEAAGHREPAQAAKRQIDVDDVLEHFGAQHKWILGRRCLDVFEIAEDRDRLAGVLDDVHADVGAATCIDHWPERLFSAADVEHGARRRGVEQRGQRRGHPAVDRADFPAVAAKHVAVRGAMFKRRKVDGAHRASGARK